MAGKLFNFKHLFAFAFTFFTFVPFSQDTAGLCFGRSVTATVPVPFAPASPAVHVLATRSHTRTHPAAVWHTDTHAQAAVTHTGALAHTRKGGALAHSHWRRLARTLALTEAPLGASSCAGVAATVLFPFGCEATKNVLPSEKSSQVRESQSLLIRKVQRKKGELATTRTTRSTPAAAAAAGPLIIDPTGG